MRKECVVGSTMKMACCNMLQAYCFTYSNSPPKTMYFFVERKKKILLSVQQKSTQTLGNSTSSLTAMLLRALLIISTHFFQIYFEEVQPGLICHLKDYHVKNYAPRMTTYIFIKVLIVVADEIQQLENMILR